MRSADARVVFHVSLLVALPLATTSCSVFTFFGGLVGGRQERTDGTGSGQGDRAGAGAGDDLAADPRALPPLDAALPETPPAPPEVTFSLPNEATALPERRAPILPALDAAFLCVPGATRCVSCLPLSDCIETCNAGGTAFVVTADCGFSQGRFSSTSCILDATTGAAKCIDPDSPP